MVVELEGFIQGGIINETDQGFFMYGIDSQLGQRV
jgi:hypothetical protein